MAKGIRIKLSGKKRYLLASAQAIAKYREVVGRELAAKSTWSNLSIWDLLVIAWACLLHEDPELKIEDVGKAVYAQSNLAELIGKISETFNAYDWELNK